MNPKTQFVRDLAEVFHTRGKRLPVANLAVMLNAAGYRADDGKPFKGKRGTYRLVKFTHRRLSRAGRAAEAAMVADVYTKPDGTHAW